MPATCRSHVVRVRRELRILRERRAGERNDVRIHPDLAASRSQRYASRSVSATSSSCARGELRIRSRNGVTPVASAAVSIGSMWRWICALLNSPSTRCEKLSMPKPSTRKPARRMAVRRSAVIASMRFVLMNCRCAGMRPLCFAATMPSHSGRIRRSRVKLKMSSWKMMVRTRGCAADDPLDHVQALVGLQARDGGDAALRLVQEVGRRAERAAHRTVVERDQPHRADLGQVRLARRLARQRTDAIGRLEALPVGRIRHLVVGGAEDRVAQLIAGQRASAAS